MTYTYPARSIYGDYIIRGRIVGRDTWVDRNGRRCYLFLCEATGNVFSVSEAMLRGEK